MADHTDITPGDAPAVTAPGYPPPLLPRAPVGAEDPLPGTLLSQRFRMRAADRLRLELLIEALIDILDRADLEADAGKGVPAPSPWHWLTAGREARS